MNTGGVRFDLRSDRGSAPAEFVLVSVLLLALVLGVLQLGAVLFVRNTVQDAAAEGARWAALAGNGPADGVARTRQELTTALGGRYAHDVRAVQTEWHGQAVAEVTVTAPLPVIGFFGVPGGLQVTGHAALEPTQ